MNDANNYSLHKVLTIYSTENLVIGMLISQRLNKMSKEKSHQDSKFAVVCGSTAQFINDSYNHASMPAGSEMIFYARDVSKGSYYTYGTRKANVDKNFKLIDDAVDQKAPINESIIFNKAQLHDLYRWLNAKPWGKLLVKSAKQNTIRLTPSQVKNIMSN